KNKAIRRYVTISAVQPGSSVLAAAQRKRRVGRRSPEYFLAPRGGAVGHERVRGRLRRRRGSALRTGVDAESMALCVCAGDATVPHPRTSQGSGGVHAG